MKVPIPEQTALEMVTLEELVPSRAAVHHQPLSPVWGPMLRLSCSIANTWL
jgi:hypothetical protein